MNNKRNVRARIEASTGLVLSIAEIIEENINKIANRIGELLSFGNTNNLFLFILKRKNNQPITKTPNKYHFK